MAIVWGPYQNNFRLGIDVAQSPGSIGSGTTSVKLTMTLYIQAATSAWMQGNQRTTFTGSGGGGSLDLYVNVQSGQSQRLHQWSSTEPTASSARTVSVGAVMAHYLGSTAVSRQHTIGARPAPPPPKPNTPGTPTVTRNSDKSHTLNWSRNSTYTAVVVQRQTNDGAWQQVGRPGGNAYTFTDTSTKANSRYRYRVAGVSAGGQSGLTAASAVVHTTPGAPGTPSAKKSGNAIVVSAGKPAYATVFDVAEDGGATASAVQVPWTHSNPNPATSHRYRVRGRVASGGSNSSTLYGPWSAWSNTVQLTAAPAAPSALSPNGTMVADDAPVEFSWQHNPVDTTDQSAFELRFRAAGGDWVTVTGTTASKVEEPLSAGVYEWQVRTKGDHPNWSPWSAVARVTMITRPGAVITAPEEVVERPEFTVEWSFFQEQDLPQSAWAVEVRAEDGEVLASASGSGATASWRSPKRLADGEAVALFVRGSAGGVWSEWAESTVLAEFVPPAPPLVEAYWDEGQGGISLSVAAQAVDPERPGVVLPDAVSLSVERSVDGGLTWELVAEGLVPDVEMFDWESVSFGTTAYRVTAFSDVGAGSVTFREVQANSGALWLSGGDAFELVARLPFDPEVGVTVSRARSSRRYEGRPRAVAYAGEHLTREATASGTLLDGDEEVASRAHLETVALAEAPVHLYRDPTGARLYGVLSEVSWDRSFDGVWAYGFSVDETDRR